MASSESAAPKEQTAKVVARCEHCRQPAADGVTLKKCGGCKAVSYCSPEHQKAAWFMHKIVCRSFTMMGDTSHKPYPGVDCVRLDVPQNNPKFHPEDVSLQRRKLWEEPYSISPISAFIGLPLVIFREIPFPEQHSRRNDREWWTNQAVTFLMSDPESALAPMLWQDFVGPCQIMRLDRKPLKADEMQVILAFFSDIMRQQEGFEPVKPEILTPAFFQQFYRDYLAKNKDLAGRVRLLL